MRVIHQSNCAAPVSVSYLKQQATETGKAQKNEQLIYADTYFKK